MIITSLKMYIIDQKPPEGSRRNNDAKYTEGGGNNCLTKNICENLELSKYIWYIILVPHNNGNFKLTEVDGEQLSPYKSQTLMQE